MHDVKFDLDGIMADPALNTLSWEIIEARGIVTGDLMELFNTARAMADSCVDCRLLSIEFEEMIERDDAPFSIVHLAETYRLMSCFMAREAREIVKFLYMRGFVFPEGTTGTPPPNAIKF